MFLAHDSYYSSMANRRPSNYLPARYGRDDVFNPSTRADFGAMMRTHIRCENAAE